MLEMVLVSTEYTHNAERTRNIRPSGALNYAILKTIFWSGLDDFTITVLKNKTANILVWIFEKSLHLWYTCPIVPQLVEHRLVGHVVRNIYLNQRSETYGLQGTHCSFAKIMWLARCLTLYQHTIVIKHHFILIKYYMSWTMWV